MDKKKQVPIAQIGPDLESPGTKCIRAVVTLIWPYSSSTRKAALLLAEPDFRMRSKKGQVRVQLSGASAEAVANCRIGISDTVILSFEGARWTQDGQSINTPGRSIDWELLYSARLVMEVEREGKKVATLDVQQIAPQHTDDPHPPSTPKIARQQVLTTPFKPYTAIYASPAFLKRSQLANDSPKDSAYYNEADDDDGFEEERENKRRRVAWDTPRSWIYTEHTPPPDLPSPHPGDTVPNSPSTEEALANYLREARPRFDFLEYEKGAFEGITAEEPAEVPTISETVNEDPLKVVLGEDGTALERAERTATNVQQLEQDDSEVQEQTLEKYPESAAAMLPPPLPPLNTRFQTQDAVPARSEEPLEEQLVEPDSPVLSPLKNSGLPIPSPFPADLVTEPSSYFPLPAGHMEAIHQAVSHAATLSRANALDDAESGADGQGITTTEESALQLDDEGVRSGDSEAILDASVVSGIDRRPTSRHNVASTAALEVEPDTRIVEEEELKRPADNEAEIKANATKQTGGLQAASSPLSKAIKDEHLPETMSALSSGIDHQESLPILQPGLLEPQSSQIVTQQPHADEPRRPREPIFFNGRAYRFERDDTSSIASEEYHTYTSQNVRCPECGSEVDGDELIALGDPEEARLIEGMLPVEVDPDPQLGEVRQEKRKRPHYHADHAKADEQAEEPGDGIREERESDEGEEEGEQEAEKEIGGRGEQVEETDGVQHLVPTQETIVLDLSDSEDEMESAGSTSVNGDDVLPSRIGESMEATVSMTYESEDKLEVEDVTTAEQQSAKSQMSSSSFNALLSSPISAAEPQANQDIDEIHTIDLTQEEATYEQGPGVGLEFQSQKQDLTADAIPDVARASDLPPDSAVEFHYSSVRQAQNIEDHVTHVKNNAGAAPTKKAASPSFDIGTSLHFPEDNIPSALLQVSASSGKYSEDILNSTEIPDSETKEETPLTSSIEQRMSTDHQRLAIEHEVSGVSSAHTEQPSVFSNKGSQSQQHTQLTNLTSSQDMGNKVSRESESLPLLPAQGKREPASTSKLTKSARSSLQRRESAKHDEMADERVPNVISSWFTVKGKKNAAAPQLHQDKPRFVTPDKSSEHPQTSPMKTPRRSARLASREPQPEPETFSPAVGVRTQAHYFTPISEITPFVNHPNQTIDIMAVAQSDRGKPLQAKSGQRDWFTTVPLLHPSTSRPGSSSANSPRIRAKIFRSSWKQLPLFKKGDVIMLKNFLVKSEKNMPYLLSGPASGWCVFRFEDWDRGTEWDSEQVRGAAMEVGDDDRRLVTRLREWWLEREEEGRESDGDIREEADVHWETWADADGEYVEGKGEG